jgi:hypothetical protein
MKAIGRVTATGGLIVGLAILVVSGSPVAAQEIFGAIQGVCVSTDGQPEPEVRVVLTGPHLQGTREAVTDRLGAFKFLAVPPGTYRVLAERIGLQAVEVQAIVVELGRTTTLPTLTLTPKSVIEETVIVRAPEIAIDPVHTAAGGTLDERDYAALPVDRDYKSLISILPLANASYRGDPVNVGGSTGLENQYYIDGVNVTDTMMADRATSLPYNFVRAVEVQTAGYEAQYGRALGAVVNAVTYSGTNDFEVQAFGFIEPSSLALESKETTAVTGEGTVSYDLGVRVGGPLARDRLWYSAAVNPRTTQADNEIAGFGSFTDSTNSMRYAGKLTWQASRATNLELAVFGDPTERDQVDTLPSGFTTLLNPDPLLLETESGGTVASLRATVAPSRSLLLETSVSHQWDRNARLPATARGASEAALFDMVEGAIGGGIMGEWEEDRERTSLTAKATMIVPRHTVVAGVDYQDAEVYSSGHSYYINRYEENFWTNNLVQWEGNFHNRSPAVYLQDNWRIKDRFTLSPGLRWSAQYLVGASGGTAQQITDEWQPRLGFSWLLGQENQQRLFGSFGRFYQTLPNNLASIWYGDFLTIIEFYTTDPRDPDSVPDSVIDASTFEEDWAHQIPGLQADNFDEFTLGYERLLGARSKMTLRAVRRDLRSSFQWGYDTSREEYVLGTPGEGDFSFLPPPEREYTALEISAEGLWRRGRYRASYVLSRTWGNYSGLFYSDWGVANPGGIGSFFTPEQAQNSTGYLPSDHTHVLKLSGDYPTGFGLSVGGVLVFESGSPINDWAPGPPAGVITPIFVSPRGSAGTTPSLWDLSVRLTYNLPITQRRPLQLLLDMLHIGNPQRAVWVDEVHYIYDDDGNWAANPNYKQPKAYQPPMALRLGIQATF